MVTQKLISFKIDASQLELLDSFLPLIGYNRNKFINYALKHALNVLSYQIPVAQRYGWDCSKVNFLTCHN